MFDVRAGRKAARSFISEAAGRKTGDNLLSHPSVGALPSADYRLNERVRDGDVCFPVPIVTRGWIPRTVLAGYRLGQGSL